MDGLLVELTRAPEIRLRMNLELRGAAKDGGYPEDAVDTVKTNTHAHRLDENNLGLEEK